LRDAFCVIAFMAAHFRGCGASFVKDRAKRDRLRRLVLDKARPPGTLAAKKAMAQYQ
jgi:hypothetical protein